MGPYPRASGRGADTRSEGGEHGPEQPLQRPKRHRFVVRGLGGERGEMGSGRRVAQWAPWLGGAPVRASSWLLLVWGLLCVASSPGPEAAARMCASCSPGPRLPRVQTGGCSSRRGIIAAASALAWGQPTGVHGLNHSMEGHKLTQYQLSAKNLSAAGRGGSRGLSYGEPVHGELSWVGAAPPEGPGVEAGQARSWPAGQQRRAHGRAWCLHSRGSRWPPSADLRGWNWAFLGNTCFFFF